MLEELERRNYAPSTTRSYLRAVDEFARYFNRPPNQLGPDHIRQYQAYLFRERKLEPNTVIQHLGGIRFFYIKTLKQSWSADLTPYPKKVLHLPSILSREEVNRVSLRSFGEAHSGQYKLSIVESGYAVRPNNSAIK
jgi:site-specific recombinase XerD